MMGSWRSGIFCRGPAEKEEEISLIIIKTPVSRKRETYGIPNKRRIGTRSRDASQEFAGGEIKTVHCWTSQKCWYRSGLALCLSVGKFLMGRL